MPRIKRRLDDSAISAMLDFETLGTVWDRDVRGLRVRVGKRGATFQYFAEHAVHGRRSATFRTLGKFPAMSVKSARAAAMVEAGRIAARDIRPGKRAARKFSEALDDYEKFLRQQSAEGGRGAKPGSPPKAPRHADNVAKLRRLHLVEFEKWPLSDLSNNPVVIRDWHTRLSADAGPITANRAAEVMRACYRYSRKLDRTLPFDLPTSGIAFNPEVASQDALAPKDFPKWAKVWQAITSPTRRAYHLFCLLSGCRPGEAAGLRWSDVQPRSRSIVVGHAKAGSDIAVPLSVPIIRALKLARAHAQKGEPLIFPGCAQAGHREDLPVRGNALRHTYRTVAADCGIDEMVSHFLLGHAPAGISQRYVARMILQSGPAMRRAQAAISRRMVELLGVTV